MGVLHLRKPVLALTVILVSAVSIVAAWFSWYSAQSADGVLKPVASVNSTIEPLEPPAPVAVKSTHRVAARDYEAALVNASSFDIYILEQLEKAGAGDGDAAHYLAEALQFCIADLVTYQLSAQKYVVDPGWSDTDPQLVADHVMDALVGYPEFYRLEARRHLDRALACLKLGWSTEYIDRESKGWEVQALILGQPVAVARAAQLSPRGGDISEADLLVAQEQMRAALAKSRDNLTFLYAATVATVTDQRDYVDERLAWALLACRYRDCGSLSFVYRHACESMVLRENFPCTDDMSDYDYLFFKYPASFDAARARADELFVALESQQWEVLGLE